MHRVEETNPIRLSNDVWVETESYAHFNETITIPCLRHAQEFSFTAQSAKP